MAWYNKNLTQDTFKMFCRKNETQLHSIEDCYNQNLTNYHYRDNIKKLEKKFDEAWDFFLKLQTKCQQENLYISIPKSHIKGHIQETGKPNYSGCLYVEYQHNGNSYPILNLSVVRSNVTIEIRHPIKDIFSIEEFNEENTEIYTAWQIYLPTISLAQYNNIETGADSLLNYLANYVLNIRTYLNDGHKIVLRGKSAAESILYQDIIFLYEEFAVGNNWLRHGDRPVENPNGNWLELDIQLNIIHNNKPINMAIEIQGRHHYPQEYKNKPELWKNVEDKHQTKINWCRDKEVIFVWLDWQAFNDVVIKNGTNPRKMKSRIEIVKQMIERIISTYNERNFYIEIFAETNKSALTFSTEEKRPKNFI